MQGERRDKSPLAIHHRGEMAQGSLPRKLLQQVQQLPRVRASPCAAGTPAPRGWRRKGERSHCWLGNCFEINAGVAYKAQIAAENL